MTTLTVDADQITITEPRSAVIVMDGEMQEITEPVTRKIASVSRDNRDVLGGDITVRSALTSMPEQVRRLTEPCQTCKGRGYVGHDSLMTSTTWEVCPAGCHEGKPTFTLHQRCVPMCVNGTVGRWADGHPCGYCDGSGVIDLGDGWTITEVLPMHDGGTKLDTYPPDAFYWTKGEGWWRDSQFDKIVTMPPAAKPGMFVVFAEQEPTS